MSARLNNDEQEDDRRWMRRALALARRGRGSTRPNPMVGAVVVRGGSMLAEGFHRRAGEPHAEINALAGLSRRGRGALGATVYVNLEPCCHTGRTAPCTDALIAAGVARVVVGVRDPNPLVNGRGIARLRRAGIRVDVGCLDDQCRALNRPFFMWVRERRPLVTLKVAATLDGFISDGKARGKAAPVWITGPAAREAAHVLRAEHDAVLVGAGTVRADNPRLTVRLPGAKSAKPTATSIAKATVKSTARLPLRGDMRAMQGSPLRVVLDGNLSTASTSVVLDPVGGMRTLVLGSAGASPSRARELRAAGADVELLKRRGAGTNRLDVGDILRALAKRDIQSLLVEGGAEVHAAFIAAGLVDRVAFFTAPVLLGGGVPVARGSGSSVGDALRLGQLTVRRVGADLCVTADVLRT